MECGRPGGCRLHHRAGADTAKYVARRYVDVGELIAPLELDEWAEVLIRREAKAALVPFRTRDYRYIALRVFIRFFHLLRFTPFTRSHKHSDD